MYLSRCTRLDVPAYYVPLSFPLSFTTTSWQTSALALTLGGIDHLTAETQHSEAKIWYPSIQYPEA